MLTTFLSTLSSYLSNPFILGDFIPALAFVFMNSLLGYCFSFTVRVAIDAFLKSGSVGKYGVFFTILLICTAILAYVMSSLNPRIVALLEGHWGATLSRLFSSPEIDRLQSIETELQSAVRERIALEGNLQSWKEDLSRAREGGSRCFPNRSMTNQHSICVSRILDLCRMQAAGQAVRYDDLDNLRVSLQLELQTNDANSRAKGVSESLLDSLHQSFILMAESSLRQAQARNIAIQNARDSSFGVQGVACTAMGNIANTVQSYSITRYGFNFESLWPRLRQCVQEDKNMYGVLQEASVKLEFLTGSCALSALLSLEWVLLFWYYGWRYDETVWIEFILLAICGPLVSYVWYRIAVEHYRQLAYIFRSCVDLYRFKLLEKLSVALPADATEEMYTWDYLNRWSGYGEQANFRFVRK